MAIQPESIAALLKGRPVETVDQIPWADFPVNPGLNARLGRLRDSDGIEYLAGHFTVTAEKVRGIPRMINGPVCRDSCVELFFGSAETGEYFNLEMNCLGTVHIAGGPNREERRFIPEERIRNDFAITTSLQNNIKIQSQNAVAWELSFCAPITLFPEFERFCRQRPDGSQVLFGNIYKCGDDTPEPHFVTRFPIQTPTPDFHRPEYFQAIELGTTIIVKQ